MTIEEKINKISAPSHTSVLKRLDTDSATTIAEFWSNVVEPMLPDYDTMKKWHAMLVEYVSLPNAVFMLRRAHDEAPAYIETVPADALRRGFLTKTDKGYWLVYNDNAFATYVLAMVLDRDIIDHLKAEDLLKYLQTPNSTIRFHRSGKGGVEQARAYFKISGAQPKISPYGYTVAHIFDVNDHYYDDDLGFNNARGDQALRSSNVQIDRGMYSDYALQGSVSGKNIYYRDNYHVGDGARKFLEAHMLRFLHPLNYFCAPKDNMNGYTYCEFTDHVHTERGRHTHRRFRRISGYEHLLYYAHHKFKEQYGDIYDDFLTRIMLPKNTFDFFEKSIADADYYGTEIIDVKYGNPLLYSGGTTPTPAKAPKTFKNPIDLTNISSAYLEGFKVGEIAHQVLGAILKSGKVSKSDVDLFKTAAGTKMSFGFEKPLLSPVMVRTANVNRYYADQFVLHGEKLFLYSQWLNSHKERLIKWICEWVKVNGSLV